MESIKNLNLWNRAKIEIYRIFQKFKFKESSKNLTLWNLAKS